jgi:hypothetical protein
MYGLDPLGALQCTPQAVSAMRMSRVCAPSMHPHTLAGSTTAVLDVFVTSCEAVACNFGWRTCRTWFTNVFTASNSYADRSAAYFSLDGLSATSAGYPYLHHASAVLRQTAFSARLCSDPLQHPQDTARGRRLSPRYILKEVKPRRPTRRRRQQPPARAARQPPPTGTRRDGSCASPPASSAPEGCAAGAAISALLHSSMLCTDASAQAVCCMDRAGHTDWHAG